MQIPLLHRPRRSPSDSELDALYAMLVGYAVRRTDNFDEALRQLPPQEQAAVRAHDLEGEEADAIVRRMGLSESYVCKLLSQGHTRLKKY